jgi:hypothetical protein
MQVWLYSRQRLSSFQLSNPRATHRRTSSLEDYFVSELTWKALFSFFRYPCTATWFYFCCSKERMDRCVDRQNEGLWVSFSPLNMSTENQNNTSSRLYFLSQRERRKTQSSRTHVYWRSTFNRGNVNFHNQSAYIIIIIIIIIIIKGNSVFRWPGGYICVSVVKIYCSTQLRKLVYKNVWT